MKQFLSIPLYFLFGAAGVTIGFRYTHYIVLAILLITTLALVYYIYFWPKYRYFRLAAGLCASWLAVRMFPTFFAEYVSETKKLSIFFGENGNWWFYDFTILITVLGLALFDLISNNPNIFSKLRQVNLNFFQSQKESPGSVLIGGSIGDNSRLTVINEAQIDVKSVIENGLRELENGQSNITIKNTEALLLHHDDILSDQQRLLACINLGNAYQQIEDLKNSSKYFLSAYDAQPSSELGMAYRAAAYLNLQDFSNARKYAQQALEQHPNSALAYSICLRLNESNQSTEAILSEIPTPLQSSSEILYGAYCRAAVRHELEQAERFLRELLKFKPKNFNYHVALGGILVKKILFARRGQIQVSANQICELINESIELLNYSLKASTPLANNAKTEALRWRAVARHFNNDNEGAYSDFCRAIELSPQDRQLNYQFGMFMIQTNQLDKAIDVFGKAIDQSDEFSSHLMLAQLLIQRAKAGDHEHAFEVLTPLRERPENLSDIEAFEFAQLESNLLEIGGSVEDAIHYISSISNLPDYQKKILLAEFLRRNQRQEEAINLAGEAIEPTIASANFGECYQLAQILDEMDEYEDAFRLLKEITGPTSYPEGIELLLHNAHKAGEKKFILEFCERLRDNGVYNNFALELEIATYEEIHESEKALEILDAEIERNSESFFAKMLRVRRSLIGIRKSNKELIENDPTLLPSIDECPTPEIGCNVANVLARSAQPIKGAEYIYELVRRNFDNKQIHGTMAFLFGMDDRDFPEPIWGDNIGVGCAVRFMEDGKSHEDWFIIEDSENPSQYRKELDPNSTLAKELIGKKVGDRFYIRKHNIQNRMGTITYITGKMRYRKFDSMFNSEERFPDSPFGISIQVPKKESGDIDGAKLIEMLEKAHEPIRELESWSSRYPITPVVFSQITGESVFECMMQFISDPKKVLHCSSGSADEFAVSSTAFDEHNKVVLEASALTTLYATQFLNHLTESKFEFIVCESTIQKFRSLLQNNDSVLWSKTCSSTLKGKFQFIERTDDHIQQLRKDLESLIKWIDNNCRIIGGVGALDLPNQTRQQITEYLGIETLEVIGAAVTENAILWTDDIAVSVFVAEERHCPTIWSDLMFEKLGEGEIVRNEFVTEVKTKLLCFGYSFTRINTNVLRYCLDQSKFDSNSSPLLELLEWFNKNQVDPRNIARLAIQILKRAWDDSKLSYKSVQVTNALMRSVGKRIDAHQVFQALYQLVGPAFPVNVVAENACQDAIVREIKLLNRKSTLILPGDVEWPI